MCVGCTDTTDERNAGVWYLRSVASKTIRSDYHLLRSGCFLGGLFAITFIKAVNASCGVD